MQYNMSVICFFKSITLVGYANFVHNNSASGHRETDRPFYTTWGNAPSENTSHFHAVSAYFTTESRSTIGPVRCLSAAVLAKYYACGGKQSTQRSPQSGSFVLHFPPRTWRSAEPRAVIDNRRVFDADRRPIRTGTHKHECLYSRRYIWGASAYTLHNDVLGLHTHTHAAMRPNRRGPRSLFHLALFFVALASGVPAALFVTATENKA